MYADLVYLVWTLTGTTKLMVVRCGVLIASGASIIYVPWASNPRCADIVKIRPSCQRRWFNLQSTWATTCSLHCGGMGRSDITCHPCVKGWA